MISEFLSTTNATSREVSGTELAEVGEKAQSTKITAQVVPQGTGSFEVEFQVAVVDQNGGKDFTKIGTFQDGDEVLASAFPISLRCLYRFEHKSGETCKVLATG